MPVGGGSDPITKKKALPCRKIKISDLEPGTTFQCRARVVNDYGEGNWGSTITVETTTAIEEDGPSYFTVVEHLAAFGIEGFPDNVTPKMKATIMEGLRESNNDVNAACEHYISQLCSSVPM